MKSFKLLLASVFTLTALVIPAATSTAAPPKPGLVEQPVISGGGANKLPSVATGNGSVHVAWSGPDGAMYGGRAEESGSFSPISLGSVGGNTTYFTAAVDVGDDGTVHYAWINAGGTIYYRNQRPGQAWSGQQVVAQFEDFPNSVSIAAKGSSEVFISWRHEGDDPNGYARFAYSNNAGASWPVKKDAPTPTGTYAGRPDLAAGPNNGPAFLAWTGTDGEIYVGQWNGDNFASSCITCERPGSRDDFFNPTIAVGPDGRPYVAWRSVGRGVFYASRQDNGTWGISNQFRHTEVSGPVSIDVDSRSNIHLAWISKQSGSFETWYAVKTPTEDFSDPIIASLDRGVFKANVDMAVSAKQGRTVAHIAWESFGSQQVIRYARVQTDGIGCTAATGGNNQSDAEFEAETIPRNPIYFPMVSIPPAVTPPPPIC